MWDLNLYALCLAKACLKVALTNWATKNHCSEKPILNFLKLLPLLHLQSCNLLSFILRCIPDIGIMVRVFANGLGDSGSIPGRVIPKTLKMILGATLLNTQHYKVRVKWSNPGKKVAPTSTTWCRSYQKGSLRVTLDYGCQPLYLNGAPNETQTYSWRFASLSC